MFSHRLFNFVPDIISAAFFYDLILINKLIKIFYCCVFMYVEICSNLLRCNLVFVLQVFYDPLLNCVGFASDLRRISDFAATFASTR